ncbi:MAG: sodium-dependent bicarbonate transport family permease, partial [Chthoniobacteraceae bacterium]
FGTSRMDTALILSNLLNPPVLFFFLGLIAWVVGSDLEIPQPLPKFFSLYLLLSIGFKGGVELHKSGLTVEVVRALGAAMVMAVVVPVWTFFVLRRKLDANNAAAVAATYGSVSAVTFIAATSFLAQLHIPFGGHMVAAMALMESPAIIVGIALARWLGQGGGANFSWSHLLRDAFANGSVLVLCGALLIGALTGESGGKALAPFTTDIFRGMLCLFLLDMGLVSGRRLSGIRQLGLFPVGFAVLVPLVNAAAAIAIAHALGLGRGDALLFTVLCASASYIAVPAAMRLAVPEANPGLYVTMALALTFPFNIILGLPLYLSVIDRLWN